MAVTVREATQADIAPCVASMASSNPWSTLGFTRQQCEQMLAHPGLGLHVATAEGGVLVWFVASLPEGLGGEPLLEYLCVFAPFRNRGVGSALVGFFNSELSADADNLYLFVSDVNPDAIRLYNKLGYHQVGAFANFTLVGQTEFLLRHPRRPRLG